MQRECTWWRTSVNENCRLKTFLGALRKVPSIRHGKMGEIQNFYNSLDEQEVVGFKAVIRILCIIVTERIYLSSLNVFLNSFCWFRERLPN